MLASPTQRPSRVPARGGDGNVDSAHAQAIRHREKGGVIRTGSRHGTATEHDNFPRAVSPAARVIWRGPSKAGNVKFWVAGIEETL